MSNPVLGNGKICYLKIPSHDVRASVNFYQKFFGCNERKSSDGSMAFDHGVGQVSGTFSLLEKLHPCKEF
jgi:extradiol dioxygenase family protein